MEPQIMSEIEFGRSIGLRGQTLTGQPLADFRKLYNEYRSKAVLNWEVRSSGGKMVRVNPTTGMVMAATNAAGEPQPMGASDPFSDYMNPAGVAGAAVDTNSAAFTNVAPTNAPTGNAVAPVNVNPAAPAGPQGVVTNADPAAVTAAAAKVYKREEDVIADARAGYLSKQQAQQILVNQFGLDP